MSFINVYIYIYLYVYVLAKAGQTAEPNWLKSLEETHVYPGGNKGKTKSISF